MIPESLRPFYPNPVRSIGGTPAVVFRDHRWTLPVIFLAAMRGLAALPARVAVFDRHPDSLPPNEDALARLNVFRAGGGTAGALAEIVANRLSPRDDDWIPAGMEAGLISDVVRFGSEPDGARGLTRYRDGAGVEHRVFSLGMPSGELAYKGALADPEHKLARAGLREVLGWNPAARTAGPGAGGFVLDIDLDFFTIAWEKYTLPFPEEVYAGEFSRPLQSDDYGDYRAVDFMNALARGAGIVTVACEPDFCDGEGKARRILGDVDRLLFGGAMNAAELAVDYPPCYPVE